MKIKLNRRYLTRDGRVVRIHKQNKEIKRHPILRKGLDIIYSERNHAVYSFAGDNFQSYTRYGKVFTNRDHPFDLIKEL